MPAACAPASPAPFFLPWATADFGLTGLAVAGATEGPACTPAQGAGRGRRAREAGIVRGSSRWPEGGGRGGPAAEWRPVPVHLGAEAGRGADGAAVADGAGRAAEQFAQPLAQVSRAGDRRAGRLSLDHGGQMVARLQERRDDVGIDRQRPAANLLQDRLDPVREPGDGLQADHRRGALEAVGRPEGLVQVRTVPLAPLQVHQPLFQADQKLARLLEEHLAEPVVRTRQDPYPHTSIVGPRPA